MNAHETGRSYFAGQISHEATPSQSRHVHRNADIPQPVARAFAEKNPPFVSNKSRGEMRPPLVGPYTVLAQDAKGCCSLHARTAAITAAVFSLSISILVVLIYSWRISVNEAKFAELEDVYYGVQIAYFAIIGTQLFMMLLSVVLLAGVVKEKAGLVAPWIMGCVAFLALEAVAMVYSNVLRDHVNRQFDAICKAEVAFYLCRAVLNVVALSGVMRFYHLLKAGITWKGPESIEL